MQRGLIARLVLAANSDELSRVVAVGAMWAFAALIYFKVAFAIGFSYRPLGVTSALLMAVAFACYVLVITRLYMKRLRGFIMIPQYEFLCIRQMMAGTLLTFIIGSVVFGCLIATILFGFSKEIQSIQPFRFFTMYFGGAKVNEDAIIYWLIVIIPTLLYYVLFVGIYAVGSATARSGPRPTP